MTFSIQSLVLRGLYISNPAASRDLRADFKLPNGSAQSSLITVQVPVTVKGSPLLPLFLEVD